MIKDGESRSRVGDEDGDGIGDETGTWRRCRANDACLCCFLAAPELYNESGSELFRVCS